MSGVRSRGAAGSSWVPVSSSGAKPISSTMTRSARSGVSMILPTVLSASRDRSPRSGGGGEVADLETGVHGGVPAADEQVTSPGTGRTDHR